MSDYGIPAFERLRHACAGRVTQMVKRRPASCRPGRARQSLHSRTRAGLAKADPDGSYNLTLILTAEAEHQGKTRLSICGANRLANQGNGPSSFGGELLEPLQSNYRQNPFNALRRVSSDVHAWSAGLL